MLALPQIAIISRLTRAGMIEVLRSNYVRTARAKGLSEQPHRHRATRCAARSCRWSATWGPPAAGLITGSLVVEQIFSLPGLGKLLRASAPCSATTRW